MRRKVPPFNTVNFCARYVAGEGLESLTHELGIGWTTGTKILKAGGVIIRTHAEAQILWRIRVGPERRKEITRKANASLRGTKMESKLAKRMAVCRAKALEKTGSFIGVFEEEIALGLQMVGYSPVKQKAVGPYNIDIAIGTVAVEVVRTPNSPFADPHIRKRTKKLIESNWAVIQVWVTRIENPDIPAILKQLVSLLQFLQRNKSSRRKYWVVRGTGELFLTRFYLKHWTYVPTSVDSFDSRSSDNAVSAETS